MRDSPLLHHPSHLWLLCEAGAWRRDGGHPQTRSGARRDVRRAYDPPLGRASSQVHNHAGRIRTPLVCARGALVCNEPMTPHGQSVVDELKRLVGEGHISADALHVITGVPVDSMRALLGEAPPLSAGLITNSTAPAADEASRLSILTAQLTDGMQIRNDERLKGILDA